MTWTKLGDEHFDTPARLDLSRDARLLEVEALVWCNRTGTDGAIPGRHLRRVTDADDPDSLAAELVAAGLWQVVDTGWQVAAWGSTQPLAADVEREKAQTRARVAQLRAHRKGEHHLCTPGRCSALPTSSTAVPTGVRTGVGTGSPTRPDPTRPDPKGGTGSGKGQRAAPEAAGGRPGGLPAVVSEPRAGTTRVTFGAPAVAAGDR